MPPNGTRPGENAGAKRRGPHLSAQRGDGAASCPPQPCCRVGVAGWLGGLAGATGLLASATKTAFLTDRRSVKISRQTIGSIHWR
jgi:hypothetical protein